MRAPCPSLRGGGRLTRGVKAGAVVLLAAAAALLADRQLRDREVAEQRPQGEGVAGVWEALEYRLSSGEVHPLAGRIFFGERDWQVLFFVMDAEEPRRGSGEGGLYELRGDTITFIHLFNLSAGDSVAGLPESPLRLSVTSRDAAGREPTRITARPNSLTLHFPSGNEIDFVRR